MAGILGGTPSYLERGTGLLGQAAQTRSMMQKKQSYPEAEKTAGGGILSAAAMASAGAVIGPELSAAASAGPWGLAIGGIIGLGAYLLS